MATLESFIPQAEAFVLASFNDINNDTLGNDLDALLSAEPSWTMAQQEIDDLNEWRDTWKNEGIFNWRDLWDLVWAVIKAIWDAIFG